jgi:hypothetical protein
MRPSAGCECTHRRKQRFGAVPWKRKRFLDALAQTLTHPTKMGPWSLDLGPAEAEKRIAG